MKILRLKGADGRISCLCKTAECEENALAIANAKEFDDYQGKLENVIFENGETEKIVTIQLVDNTNTKQPDQENEDKMFRVILSDPEPKAVKMSRKK